MARRSRAEECAVWLLAKHDIDSSPIPVEKLAELEGVQVVRTRSRGTEAGFALRDEGRRIIGVNLANPPLRQRFTIAHELGHLMLHPGKPLIVDPSVRINKRNEISSLGTDFEEIQANAFAVELLMPRGLIAAAVARSAARTGSHSETITDLARDFEVSQEAMSYRLINLGFLSG